MNDNKYHILISCIVAFFHIQQLKYSPKNGHLAYLQITLTKYLACNEQITSSSITEPKNILKVRNSLLNEK